MGVRVCRVKFKLNVCRVLGLWLIDLSCSLLVLRILMDWVCGAWGLGAYCCFCCVMLGCVDCYCLVSSLCLAC